MKVERISYQKIFPLAMYINEKIGVDILINEGDDPMVALAEAKKMVHEFHEKTNDPLPEVVTGEHPIPVHQLRDNGTETDLEYEKVKNQVEGAKTKQEAEDIILKSGFRFHKELNNIASLKPNKSK